MITFAIATLNESQHVRETISSILAQAPSSIDCEILVADGGSSDNTMDIVNQMKAEGAAVNILQNGKGTSAAGWNLAINEAQHPIVTILSGHVLLPQNFVVTVTELLHPEYAGVGFRLKAIGSDNTPEAHVAAMNSAFMNGPGLAGPTAKVAEASSIAFGSYWRHDLLEIGGFDEKILRGQDWELNQRLMSRGRKLLHSDAAEMHFYVRDAFPAFVSRFWRAGLWKPKILLGIGQRPRLHHILPSLAVLCGLLLLTPIVIKNVHTLTYAIVLTGCVTAYSYLLVRDMTRNGYSANPLYYILLVATCHALYGIGFLLGALGLPGAKTDDAND